MAESRVEILKTWLAAAERFEKRGLSYPPVEGGYFQEFAEATVIAAGKLELKDSRAFRNVFNEAKKSVTDPSSGAVDKDEFERVLLKDNGRFFEFFGSHPWCTFVGVYSEARDENLADESVWQDKRLQIWENIARRQNQYGPH